MRSLPSWQVPFLGLKRFPRGLTRFEIDTFFTFADAELAAIRSRRGDALRLAAGVHLGFLRMTGTTLDALDRIPALVLARVATQLDLPSVDIATVRSLYRRRRRTLFEHQRWAMATLGIEPFTDHRARALVRAFSPPAMPASSTSVVTVELMRWLCTRGVLIPGARRVRFLATHVRRRAEEALATTIVSGIGEPTRQDWAERLFATRPETTATYLQWLATPPAQRSPGALAVAIEKRQFLVELGAPTYPLPDVPLATVVDLAGRCRARRPSAVARLPEPGRSVELACFLRNAWLEINDTVLALADALTTDLRREAHGAALRSAAHDVASLRAAIGRVAVDTHGYTDFAMGLARLLGFDLCPRLKGLRDRRLHLPVGFAAPEAIASITRTDVVPSTIESEWDTLVRLAASIRAGTASATAVLERLGSASRGDPLYRAGTMLGRIERTLLLCDVLTNPDFRRTLHRDLSHGEAVHSLQRAIHRGTLGPRRGRRGEEMAAISGSLTLLTNLVMMWNTLWLQRCHEEALAGRGPASVDHVVQMAPIHHRHINFNGELRFEFGEAGARLFAEPGASHG